MACTIVVALECNLPKGEIVQLFRDDHVFSAKERMSVFISEGGRPEDWSKPFTHIKITNKSYDDLVYLLEPNDTGERRWYFDEPVSNTPEWLEMSDTGEVVRPWSVASSYLRER